MAASQQSLSWGGRLVPRETGLGTRVHVVHTDRGMGGGALPHALAPGKGAGRRGESRI